MADELLAYYEKELAYIRHMGAEFAKEHPKIASSLGIDNEVIEDPHVSRLIESFAYLNARIQYRMDDDFPEMSDALLTTLFPHYLRPIPSLTIVQFQADREKLDKCHTINADTLLIPAEDNYAHCRFKTSYPTELAPIEVNSVSLLTRPFSTPGAEAFKGAKSCLKIVFETFSKDLNICELGINTIRLHLRGQEQHTHPLYRLLLNSMAGAAVAIPSGNSTVYSHREIYTEAAGFDEDEGLLPYPDTSFLGYRLITEFFAFPEKFMFVDIVGLNHINDLGLDSRLELYLYLDDYEPELEHNISTETLMLGCTPAINLFRHDADPVHLDHTEYEYPVIADIRSLHDYEVYSIDSVGAVDSEGNRLRFPNLYGIGHNSEPHSEIYWYATRRNAKQGTHLRDDGTDVYISFVELDLTPSAPARTTVTLETTCSNRDLPVRMPRNAAGIEMQAIDKSPPCSGIRAISHPTHSIRPALGNHARWRLISHLNLNSMSLIGTSDVTEAVKEMLRLYDFRDSSASRALIDAIEEVSARPTCTPLYIDGYSTVCRGTEIEVSLAEERLSGNSGFLFASVLEHFFAAYCSFNSFTRLLVIPKGKEGYIKKCPPRNGSRILL